MSGISDLAVKVTSKQQSPIDPLFKYSEPTCESHNGCYDWHLTALLGFTMSH